jgi:hypothetical protein
VRRLNVAVTVDYDPGLARTISGIILRSKARTFLSPGAGHEPSVKTEADRPPRQDPQNPVWRPGQHVDDRENDHRQNEDGGMDLKTTSLLSRAAVHREILRAA